MSANIPLSVQAVNSSGSWSNEVVVGASGSNIGIRLDSKLSNTFWFVLIDRQSLKVELNINTTNNSDIPAQLKPYLGNTEYILVFSTQNLGSAYLPQGDLYNFLKAEGASVELERLEQVYASFNCGTWGYMTYSFIAVLGDDGGANFEAATILDSVVLQTIQLKPMDIGGKTYYTPVSIS